MTRDELEAIIYGALRNEYKTPEIMRLIDEYSDGMLSVL